MHTTLSEHQPLNREVSKHKLLKDRLCASYPEFDVDELADTLEGLTDLNEMIAALIRSALVDEALQQGLKARLQDMKERLTRLEHRSAKKRSLALEAMNEVGLKKLDEPDFTASARRGIPGLVIVAEDEVPEDYWVPQPAKLDRQSLLADLKLGASINGTELSKPKPSLSVRTK